MVTERGLALHSINGAEIALAGRPTVVVLSVEEYERLMRPVGTLVDFLEQSPLRGAMIDAERSRDPGREIDL